MGLEMGDLEKVNQEMSIRQCYERIYNWHRKFGVNRMKENYKKDDDYSNMYLKLLNALPLPNKATQEDMDFIFGEVISMLMEWSYHEEDENGIKMAAYAHFALNKQYKNGYGDSKFRISREASDLFKYFSFPSESNY